MIDDSDDSLRTFIVTVNFKVSGYLPDMVTKEHIEGNISSGIQDVVSEIALSSEYYDMQEDIEWGVYLEGDVKIKSTEFSVNICNDPFCEHCGERHTDFGIEISDDGTSWCMDCFLSENDDVFSKEELKEIYKKEKFLRREYLIKQLYDLEKDDEEN